MLAPGDDEDVSRDGSTLLLTNKVTFRNVVILGAPACGKTTLLQKMRYWAALAAHSDEEEFLPVFIALTNYAAFVDEARRSPPPRLASPQRRPAAGEHRVAWRGVAWRGVVA